MNKNLKLILVMLALNLTFNAAFAQKKDSTRVGNITGLLRDSVHNYVMQSATLAIYKVDGDSLISYQLSNNFGRYEFKLMPVGVPLRIIATNIGYGASKKEFTIPANTKKIDLKTINMTRQDAYLKEVNIVSTPPPMQIRGDTLEFNAGAFKLDPNAVVEDMLRKLPGVTVWGDGVITVNGKAINKLLVDGKDFMGGDSKIALQNIPKSAIQKVQVYHDKEDKDPINPSSSMNIVLKKDKKDGFFGKLGFGYGTDKRYAGDGMIAYFSPKTQLNFVGTTNNVNKSAGSASQLVTYNSFKGEGINEDYHSDFNRSGLNVFKATGVSYSHDFSDDNDTRQPYYKTNSLKADFFLSDSRNETIGQSQTLTSLGKRGTITGISENNGRSTNYGQRTNANYTKRFEHATITAAFNVSNSNSTGENTGTEFTTSTDSLNQQKQTQRLSQSISSNEQNSVGGNIRINTDRYYDFGKNKSKSISMDLNYAFNVDNGNRESTNITDFKATDITQNKYFNRRYLTDLDNNSHNINVMFRNFNGQFQRFTPFINIDLRNILAISTNKENVNVSDLATSGGAYSPNGNLSNITNYHVTDERPAVMISKGFYSGLDNRFSKNWSLNVTAESQFYNQQNASQKAFQNLNRSYYYFLPAASVQYGNNQIGESNKSYSLNYNTSVIYPTVAQMAPLNDDANVYSTVIGNLNLKPAYKQDISFSYYYYDQLKNTFNTNFSISAGVIKNNITDSTNFDAPLARNVRYYINGSGTRYLNVNDNFKKVYKLKENQFEISGNAYGSYQQQPTYVDGLSYQTTTNSLRAGGTLTYIYKGIVTSRIGETFSGNRTTQGNLSRSTYYTWGTNFGTAFALPKSIFFNTRVDFNNSKSSAANNIYYTIWNADLGYRFLKGSNAEIKFSALDLLHQNKSITNYVNSNTITTGTVNVMQQYFMLSIAYYPRKFGLGGGKK